MKNPDLQFAKETLLQVSFKAEKALRIPYETKWKLDNSPVTDIDLMVSELVISALKKEYPDDAIYSEEAPKTDGSSGFTWVLDPIDGTQVLGMLPTSTICLARVNPQGQPVLGVVANPITGELFYSESGNSFLNDQKMSVSKKGDMKSAYIYLGSRINPLFASNGTIYDSIESCGGKVFNIRSLAYSCAMVASGKAEGAYMGISTPYEAASVKLLVENAGGKITDLEGGKIERFDGEMNGLIASNGAGNIHEQLVSFVNLSNS
ncbi:MAG: inositol monophosphatase [Candidatus Paceibacterota bacterium]